MHRKGVQILCGQNVIRVFVRTPQSLKECEENNQSHRLETSDNGVTVCVHGYVGQELSWEPAEYRILFHFCKFLKQFLKNIIFGFY